MSDTPVNTLMRRVTLHRQLAQTSMLRGIALTEVRDYENAAAVLGNAVKQLRKAATANEQLELDQVAL